MNTLCHTVSERLRSQDLTMLHNEYNLESPISPANFVESNGGITGSITCYD